MAEGEGPVPSVGGDGGASRTVLGRGSIYTVATAAPLLANVLVLPLLTRLISPGEYGLVAVATVVIQVGAAAAGAGLAAAITRGAIIESAGLAGARGLVRSSLGVALAVIVVAVVSSGLWAPLVLPGGWSVELVVALVAAAGSAVTLNVQAYLRAADGAWRFVVLASVGTLLGPIVGLSAAAVVPQARVYLGGLAVGWVLAAAAGLVLTRAEGPAVRAPGGLRAGLRLGVPVVPHQVAVMLALGALVVLVGHRLGLDQGARTQVALFIGSAPVVLTGALNNAWAPVVYRAPAAERAAVLTSTTRDVALVAALGGAGVAVLSPWLLQLAAPASYDRESLVPLVALATLSSVPSVLYLANVHLVFVSGRSTALALITPSSVALGLVTTWLLLGRWGLAAAGVGFVVNYVLMAVGSTCLRRAVGQPGWRQGVAAVPLALAVAGAAAGSWIPADSVSARGALAILLLGITLLVGRRILTR